MDVAVVPAEHSTNLCCDTWQGEGGSLRAAGVGKLANLGVSVQRRWNNVLSDASRQMVVELFLGLRLPVHLPSVRTAEPPPAEPVSEGDDSDDESPLPTPRQVACLVACSFPSADCRAC